jgi:hypothetical protein
MMLPKTLFHMIPFGSIQRIAFGLEDKQSWFDPRLAASGVHPASNSVNMGRAYSGGSVLRGKSGPAAIAKS